MLVLKQRPLAWIAAALVIGSVSVAYSLGFVGVKKIEFGRDNNNADNPFVQPQDPALAGGGRDQTQQFGDVLRGTKAADLLVGRLGIDVLFGYGGDDVLVGGSEHFNPFNRDRAFGGEGDDVFVWSPGDGSDFFDGGPGLDVIMFGLLGEINATGDLVFQVTTDQQAGDVFLSPVTSLPLLDIRNSPGFCDIVDGSSSWDAQAQLDELNIDHLARFSIRGVADAFEAGTQDQDNGLRVTLHLKDVEYVVCTSRDGGEIEIFDLTVSPPVLVPESELPLRSRLLISN